MDHLVKRCSCVSSRYMTHTCYDGGVLVLLLCYGTIMKPLLLWVPKMRKHFPYLETFVEGVRYVSGEGKIGSQSVMLHPSLRMMGRRLEYVVVKEICTYSQSTTYS